MLPEIITFNKSMQHRIQEYEQLFDELETPCSEITEVWESIFEDLAVIGVDWKALWILSEKNCEKFDLMHPTAVIVEVDEFTWSELTATVKVLAVQEDIVIPSVIKVPITELHPIKVQEYDETDLKNIEDWLDKCRYFFKYLWYPWDAKLNVNMMDWCESHLRNRLKMQYDIKDGFFDKAIVIYLKLLFEEAQSIGAISEKAYSSEDDRLTVVRRYLRRKQIKTELDLFEEPYLRYGMIILKRKERRLRNSADHPEVKFVCMSSTCQSLMHFLGITQFMIDENATLKIFGSFQEALDSSSTDDFIILPPGTHLISSLRGIENGGIIKGLHKNESIIKPDMTTIPKAILLECHGFIEMENLTISKPNGIAIQVFGGAVKLKKCRIISSGNNTISRGIVVVSGGRLFLEECELEGFGTAIALQAGTHSSIINSKISNSYVGIKILEDARLTLKNASIADCLMFGIRLESSEVNSDIPLIGDLNILEDHCLGCNITSESVVFNGNKKGNVIVKQNEVLFNLPSQADVSREIICISDGENSEDNSLEEIQVSFKNAMNTFAE